ncbi:hypothetical protein OF83DRAFT_917441 [Amylostereum chailletii]|nr:hypothetical protein OF83DRAFT_917441 [Amylostereum chailletii]
MVLENGRIPRRQRHAGTMRGPKGASYSHCEPAYGVIVRRKPAFRARKPVVYLFPPQTMHGVNVTLELSRAWSFFVVYPPAVDIPTEDGHQAIRWTVDAHPDGTLVDKTSGLELSYLFWEAQLNRAVQPMSPPVSRPDSPVSSNVVSFDPAHPQLNPHNSVLLSIDKLSIYLDRALKALSLHTEARNSFITYWLPYFLGHKHVALRFVPQDSYEAAAPMKVTPAPAVITRVFMLFRGVSEDEIPVWAEAKDRSELSVEHWREVVGVDSGRAEDGDLFRVLEWGGMEVL